MPEFTEQPPRKLPKPTVWDQLYAGRFLKAGELLGKKVTLTMTDVDLEELQGDDGAKKAKAIISFKETDKKLVCCKTNGIALREMFGKQLSGWIGKRVTIFEDLWNGESCIRVWGSPDIEREFEIEISLPRRRPFKKTMHRVMTGGGRAVTATTESRNGAPPDTHRAMAQIQAAKSLDALASARRSVWAVYAEAGKSVPLEVEESADEMRESLEERAAMQGDAP